MTKKTISQKIEMTKSMKIMYWMFFGAVTTYLAGLFLKSLRTIWEFIQYFSS